MIKTMVKNYIKIVLGFALLGLLSLVSCTKYNVIETGYANGKHDTSMDKYFQGDTYNWTLTRQLIAHAGLTDVFTQTGGEGITFFGITDHSIRRYLLQEQDRENEQAAQDGRDPKTLTLQDIPVAKAKEMLERCIIKGRFKLEQIPAGKFKPGGETIRGTGGQEFETLAGSKLWIYTFREPYDRIPDAGPVSIYIVSEEFQKRLKVASSNIETLTGIVHSLPYDFTLGEL